MRTVRSKHGGNAICSSTCERAWRHMKRESRPCMRRAARPPPAAPAAPPLAPLAVMAAPACVEERWRRAKGRSTQRRSAEPSAHGSLRSSQPLEKRMMLLVKGQSLEKHEY